MNERLFSPTECQRHTMKSIVGKRTGKLLGLLGGDRTQVAQIALVTDEHDDDVRVGVIP